MATDSNKSDFVLSKEEYPEPKTKPGFSALIKEVLDLPGAVNRIVMEKGQPVRVWRWVAKDELQDEGPTIDSALSHSEIIEHLNTAGCSAPEVLFAMLLYLQNERHLPVFWATGLNYTKMLERWLCVKEQRLPFLGTELFGLPIERLESLSEDTLLLCGAQHMGASPSEVSLVIKTAINWSEVNHGQEDIEPNAPRVRNLTAGGDRHAREKPSDSGGVIHAGWHPPHFIGKRSRQGGTVR